MRTFILKLLKQSAYFRSSLKINNNGCAKLVKEVIGEGNVLDIGNRCFLDKTTIHITGNNNTITFEEGCTVGPDCSFWAEGNNIKIYIGAGTTFTRLCHINVQENNLSITIGKDCMFSNNITIRTSDSHIIMDSNGNRINHGKSVSIGNHVWIAPKSSIMKGVTIGDNVIIGSNSIVTKDIPANSLAVGMPAKPVKTNIIWDRKAPFATSVEDIFNS